MRFYVKPPSVHIITARYGSCFLCSKPLVGKPAIYLRDKGVVACNSHSFYLVLREFDNGYTREFTVVDTAYDREKAEKKASELNRSMSRGSGMSFTSYTYMPVSEALLMQPRTGLIEE